MTTLITAAKETRPFTSFIKKETAEIFVFLRLIVTNLSMRIRFRVIYKNYVILFLHLSFALSFTVTSRLLRYFLVQT